MSCTADKVLDNFRWRMESLTTHTDTDSTLKDFIYYDKDKLSGDLTSGMTRGFTLEWGGAETDGELQDIVVQNTTHDVLVRVAYYKHGDWLALQKQMMRDSFDLNKLLRNSDNWVGTSADNPTENIQIDARHLARVDVAETSHAAYLVQRWRHNMIEQE